MSQSEDGETVPVSKSEPSTSSLWSLICTLVSAVYRGVSSSVEIRARTTTAPTIANAIQKCRLIAAIAWRMFALIGFSPAAR